MEEKRKKKLENELNVLAADAKVSRALEIIESLNQIKQDEENLNKTRIEKLGFSLKAIEALKNITSALWDTSKRLQSHT